MTTKSKKIPYTKSYIKYRTLAIEANELLPEDKKLNFDIDGREHYVYRITDYTREIKQHYYGSRTPPHNKKYTSLISEFWTYRTSSKKNVLNEYAKENYKVKILKVFENPADKMIFEAYLHQYFDVRNSKMFWNGSNQTPFGFDITGNKKIGKLISMRFKGIPKSKNHIEKIRKTLTGYKHTDETKQKQSKKHSGKGNPNYGNGYKQAGAKNGRAETIEIYNDKNELQHTCNGNFKRICEEHKLPSTPLQRSYLNNIKVKYRECVKSLMINKGNGHYIKYEGWYAIKISKD